MNVIKTNKIGTNVDIGAFCYIDSNVVIGDNTVIEPFCYISGNTVIGNNCKLTHCSIGKDPQYKYGHSSNGIIEIGDNVEIREFVTVNAPTKGKTFIGNNCLLMANSHVPHDCYIDEYTVVVVGAAIGGHSKIGRHCTIGLNASLHQNSIIEDYCMIGANSFFKGTGKAGVIYAGVPAVPLKVNIVGITRYAKHSERDMIKSNALDYIENYLKV